MRSIKKGTAKEQFKQSIIKNERKEALKKCQATQTNMFEHVKDDNEYDYVYR